MHPWKTIWTQPSATIREIVKENPNRSLWLLAALYGFPSLLNSFQSIFAGYFWPALPIFIMALILSPLWGYVVLSFVSVLVFWTGKWFRGKGSFREVRAASAWGCVPFMASSAVWVIWILAFGRRLFVPEWTMTPLTSMEMGLFFLGMLVKLVAFIWAIVIYLNALAEVQKFSMGRTIGNVIVSAILVVIITGVLSSLILFFIGMPVQVQSAPAVLQSAMLAF